MYEETQLVVSMRNTGTEKRRKIIRFDCENKTEVFYSTYFNGCI